MKSKKDNFVNKMHLLCDNDDYRPWVNAIHFKGGFMYASNGYVLLRVSLELQNVRNHEKLDGKAIHYQSFRDILKYQLVNCTDEGVLCTNGHGIQSVLFHYFDIGQAEVPNFDAVIKKTQSEGITKIGFISRFYSMLTSAMDTDCKQFKMEFNGENNGIRVIATDRFEQDQVGIIMPVMLYE